jgi:hypothetical protein
MCKKRTFCQTEGYQESLETDPKVQKTSDDESILLSNTDDEVCGEPLTSTKIVLNLMGVEAENTSSREQVSPEIKPTQDKPEPQEATTAQQPSSYSKLVSQVFKDSVAFNTNFSALRFQNRDFFLKKNEETAAQRRTLTQLKQNTFLCSTFSNTQHIF